MRSAYVDAWERGYGAAIVPCPPCAMPTSKHSGVCLDACEASWEAYLASERTCADCADVPVEADGDLCCACSDAREWYGLGAKSPVRVDARAPWAREHECRCIPTAHRHTHDGHTQLRPQGAL